LEEILKKTNKSEEELYKQLALKKISEKWILSTLGRDRVKEQAEEGELKTEGVLNWDEFKGIKYTIAKCCHPLPGEEVKAVIQKGKGLVIHSVNCPNLKNLEKVAPQKVFTIRWNEKGRFPVPIRIVAHDYIGLLGDVTQIFAKHGVNIRKSETTSRGDKAYIDIVGEFQNTEQLKEVVREIKNLPKVEEVVRI
jgi:(p)ppGpp synthase/HD superfamily hydrolase